jgi:signal transduction histidine kinase
VEHLKHYRSYVQRIVVLWHMAMFVVVAGISYLLSTLVATSLALTIGAGLLVVSELVLGLVLSRPLVSATEFLARAILHVSSESAGTPAPKATSLKASTAFLEQLASYVYDMASKGAMSNYPQAAQSTASSSLSEGLRMLPCPTLIVNKDRLVTHVSASALSYLGADATKVLDKPLHDVLKLSFSSDDTLEHWLDFSENKSISGTRSWDRVKLTVSDTDVKQLDLAAHFSKDDPNGQEIVLVLFDHTDKYGKDDSGASFVSMAVHELRTPLTVMRGYIEVFEDELADTLDPEQQEFLRNLSAQAQQLGSFVSNIQNLARIEGNALELQLKQENWAVILDSVFNDMQIRAKVRHKELVLDLPESLPMVAVDHTTISEVLVNIIENAIKYTHTDAPITIKTYLKDANFVETTVEDHGIGIPDGLVGHVFDKFYRSHRSSKAVGGTGLGLYIAKTIVDAHGGQIWVKTREGQGTTFGFTIPTYESVAHEIQSSDNGAIERSAHGWIKNHTLYRG